MSSKHRRGGPGSYDEGHLTIDKPAPDIVYRLTRKGGGVVLEECEATVVRVMRAKPPDALAIVLARLSGWVEERFSR